MTLEEINNERKTLNERLQILKTQREAKVLALQQRKEAFNSDRFLGDLYKIDPAAATYFADKMAKDRQLDINANKLYSGTYTPQQKSIVDAKQQNRISMDRISNFIQSLRENKASETEIKPWLSQYDSLAANDKRLNNMLADLQTPGYTTIEVAQTPPNNNGTDGRIVMSPTENNNEYVKFRKKLMETKYSLDKIPTYAEIIDLAIKWENPNDKTKKYTISEASAKEIQDEMVATAKRGLDDIQIKQQIAATADAEKQKKYDNWLKNSLPNVSSQSADISTNREKIVSAIAHARKNTRGGAYIALKNALGDAIGKSDFAGLTGFTGLEGLKAKINEMVNNSSMNEEQAKEIIEATINGFNDGVDYHNARIKNAKSDNRDFVNTAYNAYKVDRVPMPNFINAAGGNSKITITGWGKK